MERSNEAAAIVRDAGGMLIGRTRHQKLGFILEIAGLSVGFKFEYRLFGPYSEGLNASLRNAQSLKILKEQPKTAAWGGTYSIFKTDLRPGKDVPKARIELARIASAADAIELELAATALFLHSQGCKDPWAETARRKPEKVEDGRLQKAMKLYQKFRAVKTPKPLPELKDG